MSGKYRYQDQRKVSINGKDCYSVKVLEHQNNEYGQGQYVFIGQFYLPVKLPKSAWDGYINDEMNMDGF